MPDLPKKSLGQHWLTDTVTLEAIADSADVQTKDYVLEIGPGQPVAHDKLDGVIIEHVGRGIQRTVHRPFGISG